MASMPRSAGSSEVICSTEAFQHLLDCGSFITLLELAKRERPLVRSTEVPKAVQAPNAGFGKGVTLTCIGTDVQSSDHAVVSAIEAVAANQPTRNFLHVVSREAQRSLELVVASFLFG